MVADVLSRKSSSSTSHLKLSYLLLLIDLRSLGINLIVDEIGVLLAHFLVKLVLMDHIQEMQDQDPKLISIKKYMRNKLQVYFSARDYSTLVMAVTMLLNKSDLKNHISKKVYSLAYTMHQGSTKMYHILREHY